MNQKICLLALIGLMTLSAQSVTTVLPAASGVRDMTINRVTHKVYGANVTANSVTIINTLTNTTKNVPVCNGPWKLIADEGTGFTYVGCQYSGSVTVIGPNDTVVIDIPARGSGLIDIAENPITQILATSNEFDNSVTFIDLVKLQVIVTIPVATPEQIAVDTNTNLWYFANENEGTITVVNGMPGSMGGGSGGTGSCGAAGAGNPQISLKPGNYYPPAGSSFTLSVTLVGPVCGVVTFTDYGNVIGTGNVNAQGQASFTLMAIAAGSHAFVAKFAGSPGYEAASSATVWINAQ